MAAVLAATGRPGAAAPWISQVQDASVPFSALVTVDATLAGLDCKLFMAILSALGAKSATATEHELALHARTSCSLGCGRQLLRLLDLEYGRDDAGRRQKALRLLLSLRPCSGRDHLEPTLLQVETLLAELRGTCADPGPDLLAGIVRHVFGNVPALASIFAVADLHGMLRPDVGRPMQVLASIRRLVQETRDQQLLQRAFVPIGSKEKLPAAPAVAPTRNAAAAAPAPQTKGKAAPTPKAVTKSKGKGKSSTGAASTNHGQAPLRRGNGDASACAFCSRPGHGADACWYNPASPQYRGPRSEGSNSRGSAAAAAATT